MRGEDGPEAADDLLLLPQQRVVAPMRSWLLQVAKLLLADPRVDGGAHDLAGIKGALNRTRRLERALERAHKEVGAAAADDAANATAGRLGLLGAQLSHLDQVVRLGAVQRVVCVALRLAVPHEDDQWRQPLVPRPLEQERQVAAQPAQPERKHSRASERAGREAGGGGRCRRSQQPDATVHGDAKARSRRLRAVRTGAVTEKK